MRNDAEDAADPEITYRAFKVDGGGRIFGVDVLAAGTDAEAVVLAETLSRHHGLELWERSRFILRLPRFGVADTAA